MDGENTYLPRSLEPSLITAMSDTPVVCLLGPRQCGKSTLAANLDPKRAYFSFDDQNLLNAAKSDPEGFVAQLPEWVTIDEVQRVPELLLAIKRNVDSNRKAGRYLLTGSANLLQMPRLADSLAGRMECIYLHPFTESEKEKSPGMFLKEWLGGSLETQLSTSTAPAPSSLPKRLTTGGYPEPNRRAPTRARVWHRQYIRSIIERDIHDVAQVKEGQDVARVLELLAYRTAKLLNVSRVASDLKLDRDTVERYLTILEKVFLVRRIPAWHRNSAKRLIRTPKIYLRDSGLISTLNDLKSEDWNTRKDEFGHVLESFVGQELIAQAGWTDPDLLFLHYRDKDQVEVDFVIVKGKKVWGVEVKAAATVSASDGKGLRRLAAQSGRDFQEGIVLYDGNSVLQISNHPKIYAVPLTRLWEL